jgi:flagellar motor switch protein FliM
LLRGILSGSNRKSPMLMGAEEFNLRAEAYYREDLRRKHLAEAFHFLIEELRGLELIEAHFDEQIRHSLDACLRGQPAADFIAETQRRVIDDLASEEEIRHIINLTLLTIYHDQKVSERMLNEGSRSAAAAPIH